MNRYDPLLTVKEVAALLDVRTQTVYKLTYEGRLPVVKVGQRTRLRLSSIRRLIQEWERPPSRPLGALRW
jgi:excisionase family DNA binding protein